MTEEAAFVPVDMQEMMEEGVLLAVNERFFWPMGLALAWTVEDEEYQDALHIREWRTDGEWNGKRIAASDEDAVVIDRRERFTMWLAGRLGRMVDR